MHEWVEQAFKVGTVLLLPKISHSYDKINPRSSLQEANVSCQPRLEVVVSMGFLLEGGPVGLQCLVDFSCPRWVFKALWQSC